MRFLATFEHEELGLLPIKRQGQQRRTAERPPGRNPTHSSSTADILREAYRENREDAEICVLAGENAKAGKKRTGESSISRATTPTAKAGDYEVSADCCLWIHATTAVQQT